MMRGLLCALVIAGGTLAAQGPMDRNPVHIDVVVTDARGGRIDNLLPADFEVLVNGAVQTLDGARFIRADGAAAPEEILTPIASRADEQSAAAREGTRLFGILLDEYHVTSGEATERSRAALTRFVEELGPRDLVLTVKPLDSLVNLRMTRDRAAVLEAVARFEGRKGNYAPRDAFERNFFAGSPARIDAMRAQVAISALNALATHMGALNGGRKSIVLLSEGLVPVERRRGEGPLPTIDTVIRSANRSNVAIYPLDPGGRGVATEVTLLDSLAADTDGAASRATGDFGPFFKRVLQDASGFYLLTIPAIADGRFHPLSVRVKRAGAIVRARKGYWAPSADDLERARLAAAPPLPARPAPLPRRASPLIRPWFGQARGDAGQTRVSFVWEPAARTLGQPARAAAAPVRITLKALRTDGTVVYEGSSRPAGPNTVGSSMETSRLAFQAPPGRLRIEMSIQDVQRRAIDTDVRDLAIADLSGAVTLGTAELLRARTAREFRAIESNPDAAPTAARDFTRAERLLIRVPAYTSADQPPAVTARLVSRLGGAMRDLDVLPGPRADLHQIDLPLSSLATGEYLVEFTAIADGRSAKDSLPFRITP